MQDSVISRKLLSGDEGRSLPFALITAAVGALLVGSLLTQLSTRLLGSRAAQARMTREYSSDAGVEFGIWKLVNDPAFRSQVDATPGSPVPVAPPVTVNGFTTSIAVTALSSVSGWTSMSDVLATIGAGGALAY
ncbi:MAG: hypothetical protein MUP64_05625, partial [Anaerolineae bacterium]|nr:hypothetical protein [Anaerolineae bacterium]